MEEIVLPHAAHVARDQGQRPTCIAFALSELNLSHSNGQDALSPEYVYQSAAHRTPGWISGAGVALGVALHAASAGQPVEADFPYQAAEPAAPVPAPPGGFGMYGTKIDIVPHDPSSLAEAIRRQQPVGLGIRLTNSFYRPVAGVVAFEQIPAIPQVLHAVAAVGLGWEGSEPYFLIRNSWGTQWGVRGHAWLSGSYIRAHALQAFGG